MKVTAQEAYSHIAPFVAQRPLIKDYLQDSIANIRCFITNEKHPSILLSAYRDHDSIKVIARMAIDMIDPEYSVVANADLDYTHTVIDTASGQIAIQHELTFKAGDTTYKWEWVFAAEPEGESLI